MDEMRHAHNLSHAMECAMSEDDDARLNKTNTTTCTFTCQVSRFMCTVLVLDVTSSLVLDVLSPQFHARVRNPSFLYVVVRLYLVIVNSNCSHNYCLLHIAKNGSFEVLSLQAHKPSLRRYFNQNHRRNRNGNNLS